MSNAPSGPTPPPAPNWGAPPAANDSTAPRGYGGFWLRVVAYIIDAFVLAIPTGILGAIVGAGMMSGAAGMSGVHLGINLASLLLGWLYFALMESSERGATLGKMAVGLRVVTDQGQRLSFANATGRYFAKFISAIILCIGFIMVAFTDRKRGLHDMIAGTLVVKVPG
ncbi:MAG TPA: RDD family protein [Reyranella sp.]|nr:RDD family protein [Reyranella sp.]